MENNFVEQKDIPAPQSSELVLGKALNVLVIRPQPAATTLAEGIQVRVAAEEIKDIPWKTAPLKPLLRSAFFALPAAKVDAEGRYTSDLWANVHLNARHPFDRGVNVFGKTPESDTSWAKPVVVREVTQEPIPSDIEEKLRATFRRYLPLWEKILPKIELFSGGVQTLDPTSEEFASEQESYRNKNEELIWANDKFALVVVNKPHVSGLHLVVHPRESYWSKALQFRRAWQTPQAPDDFPVHTQGFLEATAILLAAERILLEQHSLPFYNPEIHFSGNWAKDLQPVEAGGKLGFMHVVSEKARKEVKRTHRIGGVNEWATAMHGHLYATSNPDQFVSLPTRPFAEVPEQWENISPPAEEQVRVVKDVVGSQLTSYLQQNAAGQI